MISARRGAGTRRHLTKARLAASTAASTSALADRWKIPTTSRVSAGLRFSKVWPVEASTHSPSMKFLYTVGWVELPSRTGLERVSVAIVASGGTSHATAAAEAAARDGREGWEGTVQATLTDVWPSKALFGIIRSCLPSPRPNEGLFSYAQGSLP